MSNLAAPFGAPAGRRSSPRFTLRVLLVAITAVAIWLAVWTHRAREQRRIVKQIEATRGEVGYAINDRASVVDGWKARLSRVLGPDFVYDVRSVELRDPTLLTVVPDWPHVRDIWVLSTDVTDEQMQCVARLRRVEILRIGYERLHHRQNPTKGNQLSDRALAAIGRMPAIRVVRVEGVGFSAEGLKALARASSLQDIHVHWCRANVREENAEPFKLSGNVTRLTILRWTGELGEEVLVKW